MTTTANIAANRENAKLSTGPRTDAGKRVVSQNARTHGLTSKTLVLASEEQSEFDQLHARLLARFTPATDEERELLDTYVADCWRLQRLRYQETAFFNRAVAQILETDPALSPDDAMASLFTDPVQMAKMRLFLRYQSAIERAQAKSHRELVRAIDARLAEEAEARRHRSGNRTAPAPPAGFVSQPPLDPERTARVASMLDEYRANLRMQNERLDEEELAA